ncbi:MAG: DUF2321 domain-containing protein [Planctomycetota bacterium]|jgi:hypothetical protein
MSHNYDVQQVCENGHQTTSCCSQEPADKQKFCEKCGATTIIACPNCNKEIQGARIGEWHNLTGATVIPSYCPNCGEPYPWTQRKIATAIKILAEFGNLDEEEKKTIEQDIDNIAKDVPEAEISAMRIKRIWDKCSRAGYEVIMELASRTAAKILKGE